MSADHAHPEVHICFHLCTKEDGDSERYQRVELLREKVAAVTSEGLHDKLFAFHFLWQHIAMLRPDSCEAIACLYRPQQCAHLPEVLLASED